MKLVAERAALYHGLQRLGAVVDSSTQQPLYQHVKMEAKDNELRLSATDLEVGLTLAVREVEIESEGTILVPYARITPLIGATPDSSISMSEEDGKVGIKTENSYFRILGEDPTDFVSVPQFPAEGVVEIDPDVLKYMVRRTAFATAAGKGRYALHGILCVLGKENAIELVAADGARLAHVQKKVSNPEGLEQEIIIPREGLEQMARLADAGSEAIRFATSERRLVAENDAARMVCQLVEGQFPNYREVIPTTSEISVQLPTKELLNAVRRAGYMTTKETHVVDFEFTDGSLTITAEAPDVGRAEVHMPVDYKGEGAGIAFNPENIEEMLAIVEREMVKMKFTDRRSPCVFKSGLDYTYVVSPVLRDEIGV